MLSWQSAWQKPGVCIGVANFFPEALIRQFIFHHSIFFSSSSGAMVDVSAFSQLIVSRNGIPGPLTTDLAFHVWW